MLDQHIALLDYAIVAALVEYIATACCHQKASSKSLIPTMTYQIATTRALLTHLDSLLAVARIMSPSFPRSLAMYHTSRSLTPPPPTQLVMASPLPLVAAVPYPHCPWLLPLLKAEIFSDRTLGCSLYPRKDSIIIIIIIILQCHIICLQHFGLALCFQATH